MRRVVVLGLVVVLAGGIAVAVAALRTRATPAATGALSEAPARNERATPAARRAHATAEEPLSQPAVETARVIRGRVEDEDDAPIGDAEVVLYRREDAGDGIFGAPEVAFDRPLGSARTAQDGTFELTSTERGELGVIVRKPGYAPASAWVEDEDLSLELEPGADFDLLVVDGADRPIHGAEVLLGNDGFPEGPSRGVTITDAAGRARVFVEASAAVIVRAPGFTTESASVHAPYAPETLQRIVLGEGRKVEGVVVDGTGEPLSGARVRIARTVFDGQGATVRSRSDGAFTLDGLDPSDLSWAWSIGAELDGWAGDWMEVRPGETAVRIVLRRAGTVRGVVVYEDGSSPSPADTTGVDLDESGRFVLEGVVPGRREIWASAPARLDRRVQLEGATWVDVPEGGAVEDVRIVVGPPRWTSCVLVRVVDDQGKPVPDVDVDVWRANREVTTESARTDEQGSCLVVVNRPPGTLVDVTGKWRRGSGARDARTAGPVATAGAPPLEPVELRLRPVGVLRLRLVDSEGNEIPFDPAYLGNDAREFAPDGTRPLLTTARVYGFVRVPGFAQRAIDLRPPHPPVREETIRLARATLVRGRLVTEAADVDIGSMSIYAAPRGEDDRWWAIVAIHADADGRFETDLLPPGSARVYVEGEDGVVLDRVFDVVGPGPIDLGDLHLGERVPVRGVVVDDAGRPLGGCEVSFRDRDGTGGPRSICTPADGSFGATLTRGVPMWVLVSRSGFATQVVAIENVDAAPLRIVLGRPGRVRLFEADLPDPGGWFLLEVGTPGCDWWWNAHSPTGGGPGAGEDGAILYDDLPPGRVRLRLLTTSAKLVRDVDVVVGETVDVRFR